MKTAVVLYNLGGPDNQAAVKPFLFNLFNDKAIIRLPAPLRQFVAWLISSRREKTAQEIYQNMGGGSPILPNTQAQSAALQQKLADLGEVKCFIAMRYWHPFTEEMLAEVTAFAPDQIVELPLYPQFSTTTSASSFAAAEPLKKLGKPIKRICCYPTATGFIQPMVDEIRKAYAGAAQHGKPRLLLSAHGLPEKIVKSGDPYQWQCEQTAAAIVAALNIADLDWVGCYQSRVGPLKWIGPATDTEVDRAGRDKVPLIVVPIAFVSEHSETLVELGIEYRHRATEAGIPFYAVVPTVGTTPAFIDGLAGLVRQALGDKRACISQQGEQICPSAFSGCCQHLNN